MYSDSTISWSPLQFTHFLQTHGKVSIVSYVHRGFPSSWGNNLCPCLHPIHSFTEHLLNTYYTACILLDMGQNKEVPISNYKVGVHSVRIQEMHPGCGEQSCYFSVVLFPDLSSIRRVNRQFLPQLSESPCATSHQSVSERLEKRWTEIHLDQKSGPAGTSGSEHGAYWRQMGSFPTFRSEKTVQLWESCCFAFLLLF